MIIARTVGTLHGHGHGHVHKVIDKITVRIVILIILGNLKCITKYKHTTHIYLLRMLKKSRQKNQ